MLASLTLATGGIFLPETVGLVGGAGHACAAQRAKVYCLGFIPQVRDWNHIEKDTVLGTPL